MKLEPGGIYAIECDSFLTRETVEAIQKRGEALGIKLLILDRGCRLAGSMPKHFTCDVSGRENPGDVANQVAERLRENTRPLLDQMQRWASAAMAQKRTNAVGQQRIAHPTPPIKRLPDDDGPGCTVAV